MFYWHDVIFSQFVSVAISVWIMRKANVSYLQVLAM